MEQQAENVLYMKHNYITARIDSIKGIVTDEMATRERIITVTSKRESYTKKQKYHAE